MGGAALPRLSPIGGGDNDSGGYCGNGKVAVARIREGCSSTVDPNPVVRAVY